MLNSENWIRADYTFPRHIGNVQIPSYTFHQWIPREFLEKYNNIHCDISQLIEVFHMFLAIVDCGRYAGADIWAVYHPYNWDGWYVTVCHPSLPSVDEGCEIPVVTLSINGGELEEFRLELVSSAARVLTEDESAEYTR